MPDALTNEIVVDRLAQEDAAQGFLLDGYPRTLGQVVYLDDCLARRRSPLDAVVRLVADEEEVISRLTKRSATRVAATTPRTSSGSGWRSTAQTPPLIEVYRERACWWRSTGWLGRRRRRPHRVRARRRVHRAAG